jgi:glycosyltransferase involved in cell wall biosynthesis
MVSGTPIVTVDARAIQDVLSSENAGLVQPHSPRSLAAGIRRVLEREREAQALAERAYRDAQSLTLENRDKEILGFLERLTARRNLGAPSRAQS